MERFAKLDIDAGKNFNSTNAFWPEDQAEEPSPMESPTPGKISDALMKRINADEVSSSSNMLGSRDFLKKQSSCTGLPMPNSAFYGKFGRRSNLSRLFHQHQQSALGRCQDATTHCSFQRARLPPEQGILVDHQVY